MLKLKNIPYTKSVIFNCRNKDLSLIANERQVNNYQNIGNIKYDADIETGTTSQTISVSNYTIGIYTVVIFRENEQVASTQLLVVR